MRAPRKTPQDIFWSHVHKSRLCWIWTAATSHGYGVFSYRKSYGAGPTTTCRSHRFSWELHNGPIPLGMCVCHTCDNPPCVNPAHLFLGTDEDNAKDMWAKGRGIALSPKLGVANHNHKLTEADIPIIRQLLAVGAMTQAQIAEAFGVTKRVVWMIKHGVTWSHVD